MARALATVVTEADLQRAWRTYRLPSWPATFEEAMQDPLRFRLVHIHATHQVRSAAYRSTYPAPRRRAWAPPHQQDVKRAAAGDRDDD